jgi:hypothetical protein
MGCSAIILTQFLLAASQLCQWSFSAVFGGSDNEASGPYSVVGGAGHCRIMAVLRCWWRSNVASGILVRLWRQRQYGLGMQTVVGDLKNSKTMIIKNQDGP